MAVLLFFLALAGWALLIKTALPAMRAGAALLSAFCGLCALAYTGVILLGDYACTPYILLCGGWAALAACGALRLIRRRSSGGAPFWPTALLFFTLCAALTLILRGGALRWHDEYAFWARAPREMYLFGQSYFNADTNMGNRDYVPLFASLQFCVAKVLGWSNLSLYAVVIACYMCAICAAADLIDTKRWYLRWLFALFTLVLIPCCHEKFCTSYLSPDGPLALMFSCGLLLLIYRRDSGAADMLPVLSILLALPGIKIYSGLLFAAALALPILIKAFQSRKNRAKWRAWALCALAALCYVQLSWSGYANYGEKLAEYQQQTALAAYKGEDAPAAQKPRFSVGMLFRGNARNAALLRGDAQAAKESLRVVAERLFEYRSSSGILPFWLFFVVSIGLYAALYAYTGAERARQRRYTRLTALSGAAYIAGFFLTLLVQPDAATSANRYMAVLLVLIWFGGLFFLFRASRYSFRRVFAFGMGALTLFLALGTHSVQLLTVYASDAVGYENAAYAQQKLAAAEPLLSALAPEARVLLVDETLGSPETGDEYSFSYLALPRRLTLVGADDDIEAAALSARADAVIYLSAGQQARAVSAAYQNGKMTFFPLDTTGEEAP